MCLFSKSDVMCVREQVLLVERVWRGRAELSCDEHCNDHPVDGDDTGHDHWDDGFHDQLWPHDWHGGDSGSRLGRSVCRAHCTEHHGGGGAHHAEEGGVDWIFFSHCVFRGKKLVVEELVEDLKRKKVVRLVTNMSQNLSCNCWKGIYINTSV